MAHSTAAELEALVGDTAYDDATLNAIIAQGDAWIDARVAQDGITPSGAIITQASLLFARAHLVERMLEDGTLGETVSIGGLTQTTGFRAQAEAQKREAKERVELWLKAQLVSSSNRYKAKAYITNG